MTRLIRLALLLAAAVLAPTGATEACWCSRAYTSSYFNPCTTIAPVSRSSCVPVATCPTATYPTACPTPSCSTTPVERCYYEPQIVYQTRTVLQPRMAYVRRTYYDPLSFCYRSYWLPTTQYVERRFEVPVTTWTRQCSTATDTNCVTSYTRSATYWSPDGYNYYPLAPSSSNCPVPNSNGSNTRESSYGTPDSQKSDAKTSDPPNAPDPKPMPTKPKTDSTRAAPSPSRVAVRGASHTTLPPPSGLAYPTSRLPSRRPR